ncbi:MAG: response regulator, partial [Verrucomicrobiales bacterium]|nr:response regulator [Verrucomicrobiales bacterium]
MKTLIADDDGIARRILRAALTRWGYEVVEATNGEEALEQLRGPTAPELAVLDWVMPGL